MKPMTLVPPPERDPTIVLTLNDGHVLHINSVPEPIARELVKRWNAFDELLEFIFEIADDVGTAEEIYRRAHMLATKYDVPGTEDKA